MQEFEKALTNFLNQARVDNERSALQLRLNDVLSRYFEYEGKLHLKILVNEIIEERLAPFEKLFSNSIEQKSDDFLSVKEASKFLKISRVSLYNQKNNPHFPKPKRIGRRVIYSKSSLIEFLNKVKSFKRGPPGNQ